MRLRVFLLLLVLGGCIVPSVAGQGSPLPGVSLECDGGPIEVDANPQRTEQESVFQCEVTNDSALAEEIDLDFEVSGSTFTVAISEDSFSLQGGESETFDVTVRVPINEPAGTTADFDITAMVSSIQGVPIEQANVSSSDSVRLEVAEFHRLDLSRASITTPNIEAGASYALEVRVQNLGNAQSNVRVELTSETLDRLREAGFELPEEEVVSVSLNPSEESETISFSITAPVEVPEIIEESITVQASIFGLTPAVSEEITINLQVQRSTSSVVADIGGLDSLSEDTLLLIGASGAGVFLLLLLLVVVISSGRRNRRRKAARVEEFRTSQATPAPLPERPVDLDDLLEDLADLEDLDEALAELDVLDLSSLDDL